MSSALDPDGSKLDVGARGEGVPSFTGAADDPRLLRRFVWSLLAATCGLLVAVLSLNILVDPFDLFHTGLVPTAIENDRAIKIGLLYRLKASPDILILGSSRSRHAQPAFLQNLTGRTGFNAGVTGGDATDEWVFTRMLYQRFPRQQHHALIFISGGVGSNGVNPQLAEDARARRFLGAGLPSGEWSLRHKLLTYLSADATRSSLRVMRACVIGTCTTRWFHADGSLLEQRAVSEDRATRRLLGMLRSDIAGLASHGISPSRLEEGQQAGSAHMFERLLGFLNEHGVTPVVVMVPIQPRLLRTMQRLGDRRRQSTRSYLARLHRRYRFVYLDLSNVHTFGGSPLGFVDPTHVTTATMRLMLTYVVKHDNGIL
jgi:hypothetical protein